MVSTRLVFSESSSTFNNTSVTVPKAPIKFGIIATFMFLNPSIPLQAPGISFFFQFYSVVSRDSKFHNFASFVFFAFWLSLCLVVFLRLGDPFVC